MSTPAAANPEHIKFLVACIRHANNGKVDFDAVRLELDIVTKAAAAKRYERLLKAYPAQGGGDADSPSPGKKRKAPADPNGEAKKIMTGGKKGAAKIKKEDIKEEDSATDSSDSAATKVKVEDETEEFEA